MRPLPRFWVLLLLQSTVVSIAFGQGRGSAPTDPTSQLAQASLAMMNRYASVTVIVEDENGANLGQQALVRVYSTVKQTNLLGTTQGHSRAEFGNVPLSDYEVEVSAAGYETTTKELSVAEAPHEYQLHVRLKRDDSGAAANVFSTQLLPSKARKEVEKGMSALNTGNLGGAQKHLQAAYQLAPANADLDYLLGFLFIQKNDANQARGYLEKAITVDPHHVRALTEIGRLRLDQKDYAGARTVLEQAVSIDPGSWTSHWLLGEAYLETKDFEKARQEEELALQKGKGTAVRAEIVEGEALAHLGKRDEAVEAFETFMKREPKDPLVDKLHEMVAQLRETGEPSASVTAVGAVADPDTPLFADPSATAQPAAKISIPLWRPPSVDDEKPVVASGVICPSEQVIAGAGERVTELVDNVAKIDATEDVLHEELDKLGSPTLKETRKFDYIVAISELRGQAVMIDEYRSSMSDESNFPGNIATHGLHALAMVFHPLLRDDFQMTCEGLGDWHGQATWLVYFRQRADRPDRLMSYEFPDAEYPIPQKGRAWIAAKTFQIVHLESDLVAPLPKIQLSSQHQSVDYGMVHFPAKNTDLWLPKSAELYFDFRHHRYYRRHTFDNYKLFSVGATQKIGQPKEEAASKSTEKPEQ